MKVLLVCHYFAPETGAPQSRFRNFIRRWTAQGDDVQVLTGFPNHPTGIVPPEYRRKRLMCEQLFGARVVRTWLFTTPNSGLALKTLSHVSLMLSGIVLGWRKVDKPEVVLVSSPTFFSIFTAWVHARRFGVPLVIEVRDLWPGIFVELGTLTNPLIIKILEFFELRAYRAAARIVVVTEGFKDDLIARGVPEWKVETITNGVDTELFAPQAADPELRRQLGAADDQTLAMYIGTHGVSQALGSVIEAAGVAGPRVHLALIGNGAAKAGLRNERQTPTNVSFHDPVASEAVPAHLAAADILLVPLRDIDGFKVFIPSKLFECLASGTAVVGSLAGESAAILEAAGGIVVHPESVPDLAAALLELSEHPEQRTNMGSTGRAHVLDHYDTNTLAVKYHRLLGDVITTSSAG